MTKYVADTCEVICENNGNKAQAEILNFNEKRNLTVSLNRSVKLLMAWNGRTYEGKMSGMSFVSNGPTVTHAKTSSRG